VIYVWSQLLKDPKADLPGRTVLSSLLTVDKWTFGGVNWQQRRKVRRYSTALSAPINYGPGLKMLGWVTRYPEYSDVLIPTAAAGPALDAFERKMSRHLGHPAFSKFGTVTVTVSEAQEWSNDWALDAVTPSEGKAMGELLFGATAAPCRQLVGQLILAGVANSSSTDAESLRTTMAGSPSSFVPPQHLRKTWEDFRRLQIRQLFRLSLEAPKAPVIRSRRVSCLGCPSGLLSPPRHCSRFGREGRLYENVGRLSRKLFHICNCISGNVFLCP
jgi:hypothetical protein